MSKNIATYEILVTGQSRSLKVVPFDRLGIVFLLVFYSNFVIRRTVLGDNRLQLCRDLENQPRRRRRRRVAGQASDWRGIARRRGRGDAGRMGVRSVRWECGQSSTSGVWMWLAL